MDKIWIKDGKFNELTQNEVAAIEDVKDIAAYQIALNGSKYDALRADMESKVGTEAVVELIKQFGELNSKNVDALQEAMESQGKSLADLKKSASKEDTPRNFNEELKSVWAKSKDSIDKYIAKDSEGFSLNLKTEVTRASVADNTMAESMPGVGQIPRRSPAVASLFNSAQVGPDSNGVIRYWDQESFTSNAASVAESAAIPESAIAWEELTCAVEKIGDSIPVTREALNDVGFVSSEINNFLLKNIELELDRQTLLGTGTSNELKGIDSIAPNWAEGAFADLVDSASIYDVISTGLVQIMNAGQNNTFVPNAIIMNPTDAELMRLTKDADGNYVMPMWMTQDGMSVRGVRIIESQLVTQNQMYIGDFTFGTLWNSEGTAIDIATQHGTDWLDDVTRLKATVRKALVVRNAHVGAFLHVASITAAQAALETP